MTSLSFPFLFAQYAHQLKKAKDNREAFDMWKHHSDNSYKVHACVAVYVAGTIWYREDKLMFSFTDTVSNYWSEVSDGRG